MPSGQWKRKPQILLDYKKLAIHESWSYWWLNRSLVVTYVSNTRSFDYILTEIEPGVVQFSWTRSKQAIQWKFQVSDIFELIDKLHNNRCFDNTLIGFLHNTQIIDITRPLYAENLKFKLKQK